MPEEVIYALRACDMPRDMSFGHDMRFARGRHQMVSSIRISPAFSYPCFAYSACACRLLSPVVRWKCRKPSAAQSALKGKQRANDLAGVFTQAFCHLHRARRIAEGRIQFMKAFDIVGVARRMSIFGI
jgi:hypothetical protein